MKWILFYIFCQIIFNNSIAQRATSLNDSVLVAYLNAFKTSCGNVESKSYKDKVELNVEYDKRILKFLSKVISGFEMSGKLKNIRKYFRIKESDINESNSYKQYVCYTTDKNGNLNIYLSQEIDKVRKKVKIHLMILTSTKLYCKEENWLVSNFDALYLRKLVDFIGFSFVLHSGGDELYLDIEKSY